MNTDIERRTGADQGPMIDLLIGDPQDASPAWFRDGLVDALARPEVDRYPDKSGSLRLRKELANDYARECGIELDPRTDVCVTSGAWDGIYGALRALELPGGRVGYFAPNFFGIPTVIAAAGMIPVPIQLSVMGEPKLYLADAFRHLDVFIHVDPHNPTGRIFTHEENAAIADVCRWRGIKVLSDRVYKHLFDDTPPESFLTHEPEALEVWSFSKSYRMAGWRLGCLLGHGPWMARAHLRQASAGNGVVVATQLAATRFAGGHGERETWRMELRSRRKRLTTGLTDLGFGVDPGGNRATNFIWARIPDRCASARELAACLAQTGVSLLEGGKCGADDDRHVRIALNFGVDVLSEALNRIGAALDHPNEVAKWLRLICAAVPSSNGGPFLSLRSSWPAGRVVTPQQWRPTFSSSRCLGSSDPIARRRSIPCRPRRSRTQG